MKVLKALTEKKTGHKVMLQIVAGLVIFQFQIWKKARIKAQELQHSIKL